MRNAYTGYTYQQNVTLLLLAVMDVERNILQLNIEAQTNDHFDDVVITTKTKKFQLQIKDYEDISIGDLVITNNQIVIKGKSHQLSVNQNVIFFKYIDIEPNENFFGFPSFRLTNEISLVSLSRIQIDEALKVFYKNNPGRKNEIHCFFNEMLDKRIWRVCIDSLPPLKIFLTELQEKSVLTSQKLLKFDNILLIQGKPGVGKSHFVSTLQKEYKRNILYRFWVSNQDADYQDRLKFENFIRDLTFKLFAEQKSKTFAEIFNKLRKENKTFIIDGLDHIENYNKIDFDKYVAFISQAKEYCKIIVLSRPLINEPDWKKQILENWNLKQTEKVLKLNFHLSGFVLFDKIYKISQGYPIIVRYLAEHYRIHKTVPDIAMVDTIDSYYKDIIANEKGKQILSIFLCCDSFIMDSELSLFIQDEKEYVDEFLKEHPYLFDIKINRVALFHDSFNTFLRRQVNYKKKSEKVAKIVTQSILNLEKRFLSRFAFFHLTGEQQKMILIKYSSIATFERLIKNTIDFESIRVFYKQLRETLVNYSFQLLSVKGYYELSLIVNLLMREHIGNNTAFYYNYVKGLIANGIKDDDITSSDYLFGMYYYVRTDNATVLMNKTADDFYIDDYFYTNLENDIGKEQTYITKHARKLGKRDIDKALKNHERLRDNLIYIIENVFIHQSVIKGYGIFKKCCQVFLDGNILDAEYELEVFLNRFRVPDYYTSYILKAVFNNLVSYGYKINHGGNEYLDLTLKAIIYKYRNVGSFDLSEKIHSYIRLAVLQNREFDIASIYPFWTKYYQRKDYTLYGLPLALKTLESKKLMSLNKCIKIVCKVQEMSEKGNRHLLAEFIELYPPSKIINHLEKNFNTGSLEIEWLKLPTKYINVLSETIVKRTVEQLLRYHRTFSIPLEELENSLFSNKVKQIESLLSLYKKEIGFKYHQKNVVAKFSKSTIRFEEIDSEKENDKYKENSQSRFEKGVLSYRDKEFIKKTQLKSTDLARFSDGNYNSFSEIELFKIYEVSEIRRNFRQILYNSITGKTENSKYFYTLFYHPGIILSMIKHYRNESEFQSAAKSFMKFMKLSMFDFAFDGVQ